FFFSSRRRHTRFSRDWSSDVCSSDLRITSTLDDERKRHPEQKIAPFAVNQIIHTSNDRLDHDMQACEKYQVPVIITSLRAPTDRSEECRVGKEGRSGGAP